MSVSNFSYGQMDLMDTYIEILFAGKRARSEWQKPFR